MSNNIETLDTIHPVCPYCGYEHRDPDGFEVSGLKTCNKCNKEFECYVEVHTSYTTETLEDCALRHVRARLNCHIVGDRALLANAAFAYGLEKLPLKLLQIYDKMLKGECDK